MRSFAVLVLLVLAPVVVPVEAAPADVKVAEAQEIDTLVRGFLRDRALEEYRVFTDDAAFSEYWVDFVGPTPPTVDFDADMVLVAVRQQSTARCAFGIFSVHQTSADTNVTNVYVTGTLPQEVLICAPDARYGAHLATVPRLDGTVVFHAMHGAPLAITST